MSPYSPEEVKTDGGVLVLYERPECPEEMGGLQIGQRGSALQGHTCHSLQERERHSHRGCLAELHTVHCGETQRPDHWIVVLGDSLVKGKKSQFYPDPASRQAEQGSTDFKVLQVASFHPRLKEPESHDSQSLPPNYNTITFLGMGVHP